MLVYIYYFIKLFESKSILWILNSDKCECNLHAGSNWHSEMKKNCHKQRVIVTVSKYSLLKFIKHANKWLY